MVVPVHAGLELTHCLLEVLRQFHLRGLPLLDWLHVLLKAADDERRNFHALLVHGLFFTETADHFFDVQLVHLRHWKLHVRHLLVTATHRLAGGEDAPLVSGACRHCDDLGLPELVSGLERALVPLACEGQATVERFFD